MQVRRAPLARLSLRQLGLALLFPYTRLGQRLQAGGGGGAALLLKEPLLAAVSSPAL